MADLDEAVARIATIAARLRADGRAGDAGSLLKVGDLQARADAGRALAGLGRDEETAAFAAELLLDIARAFPSTAPHAARPGDEDSHLRFAAIGRRYLVGGAAL